MVSHRGVKEWSGTTIPNRVIHYGSIIRGHLPDQYLTNNGLSVDRSVAKSETLTGLAAELWRRAFGGTTKGAIDAISCGVEGETDPIGSYGVSMKKQPAGVCPSGWFGYLERSAGRGHEAQGAYGIMLPADIKMQRAGDEGAEHLQKSKLQCI